MRYISLEDIQDKLTAEWKARAIAARNDILNASSEANRDLVLSNKSTIWQEVKDILRDISYDKCWYCESKRHRSDDPVDHYRPKGNVAEAPDHKGYWWLAFDWDNYRFSCTYCNSKRKDKKSGSTGGKQDHFPLLTSYRAKEPADDLELEQPCLLDPTKTTDPGLLWFQDDGSVVSRYDQATRPNLVKRTNDSIELYHLNHSTTKRLRKVLYKEVSKLVKDGNLYFDRFAAGDYIAAHALNRTMGNLAALINPKAEFSAAARSFLAGLRSSGRDWIEALLYTC